jgi:Sugar-transfer associated ATP-grasp
LAGQSLVTAVNHDEWPSPVDRALPIESVKAVREKFGMVNAFTRYLNPVFQLRVTWAHLREVRKANSGAASNPFRILTEIVRLRLATGLARNDYFLYRLYDPAKTWEQKRSFVAGDARHLMPIWEAFTPRKYWFLYDNKVVFAHYFASHGIPLPQPLAVFDELAGRTVTGEPLRTVDDLHNFIIRLESPNIVIKPVQGACGAMVLVFSGRKTNEPGRLITLDGQEFDAERLVAFMGGDEFRQGELAGRLSYNFVIQRRVRQHPSLIDLVGPTVCTARVQTIIDRDGQPDILAAVFKLQDAPVGRDNSDHGSLVSPIDLSTGALNEGRRKRDPPETRHRVLPYSKKEYVGFILPHWSVVRDVALRAAAVFPWARSIGWDIAIGDDGPVLLEGNSVWSPTVLQLNASHGLMSGKFRELYESLRQ